MFAVSQTGRARYMVVATRSERIIENGGPRSRTPRPAALLRRLPGEGVVTARVLEALLQVLPQLDLAPYLRS